MRKMCTMVEVSKVPIMGKEEENEIELSLDLSIGGGRYGKSENARKIQEKSKHFPIQDILPRSDKLRINANGFMEDKQFLEAQQFEARVKDREIREKDGFLEELSRKNKENELNLCLFNNGDKSKEKMKNQCLFTETEYVKNEGINCNWAPQPSSSAISDSHKGGSDTGSYSSCLNSSQQFGLPEQKPGPSEKSKPETWSNRTTNTSSMSENTSTPKPVNHQNRDMGSFHHRMPCVSTKGNGPNGKTITGFLYKYSKSEVSIVCVCHGSLFTPAEFVEHAGGVDISNPLRHITIVPSSFG